MRGRKICSSIEWPNVPLKNPFEPSRLLLNDMIIIRLEMLRNYCFIVLIGAQKTHNQLILGNYLGGAGERKKKWNFFFLSPADEDCLARQPFY